MLFLVQAYRGSQKFCLPGNNIFRREKKVFCKWQVMIIFLMWAREYAALFSNSKAIWGPDLKPVEEILRMPSGKMAGRREGIQ